MGSFNCFADGCGGKVVVERFFVDCDGDGEFDGDGGGGKGMILGDETEFGVGGGQVGDDGNGRK